MTEEAGTVDVRAARHAGNHLALIRSYVDAGLKGTGPVVYENLHHIEAEVDRLERVLALAGLLGR